MNSQYRAFGECLKCQLTAGESINLDDLTTAPGSGLAGKFTAKFMHIYVQEAGSISYKLQNDIKGNVTYTLASTTVGQQITSVKQITCTTGQVEVLFFS